MMSASRDFYASFPRGGAPHISCGCGREHYARYGIDDEVDELAKDTNNVIHWHVESVSAVFVSGVPYADGCACSWPEKFEALLVACQTEVLAFYRLRLAKAQAEAVNAQEQLARTDAAIAAAATGDSSHG